jgi:hypothetical protein
MDVKDSEDFFRHWRRQTKRRRRGLGDTIAKVVAGVFWLSFGALVLQLFSILN